MTTSVRDRHGLGDAASHEAPPRPAAVSGVLAAAIVFGAGLVLCVGLAIAVWLASDAATAAAAMRAGAGFWLAGHGGAVTIGATTLTAVPLGVPLAVGTAMYVTCRRLGERTMLDGARAAMALALSAGASYGAALAVASFVTSTPEVSFAAPRAGLIGGAFAGAAALAGALSAEGWLRETWEHAPDVVRRAVAGCVWALTAMLVAASAVVAYALAVGYADVRATYTELGPGLVGGVALTLLCVLFLPNVVLLAASLVLGPGFAVGSDTSVTLLSVRLGDLPTVPVFAALPESGAQPGWVAGLAVVPVLAGVVGGVVSVRGGEVATMYDAVGRGCLAGGGAGLLLGLAVMCAGGAIGPGRMADVGAVVWAVPVAVFAMALGGASGAAAGHYRERRS